MMRDEIIEQLAQKAIAGRLLLFVGAGFSKAVVGKNVALSWGELLKRTAEHFDIVDALPKDVTDGRIPFDLAKVASRLVDKLRDVRGGASAGVCVEKIKKRVCEIVDWVPTTAQVRKWGPVFQSISPSAVVTTNYDEVLETITNCRFCPPSKTLSSRSYDGFEIYHIHGVRTDWNRIVLTSDDYVEALRPFSYRQVRLTTLLRENAVLYIGYGRGDVNFLSAYDTAGNTFRDVTDTNIHVLVDYDDTCEVDDVSDNAAEDDNVCGAMSQCTIKTAHLYELLRDLAERCDRLRNNRREEKEKAEDEVKKRIVAPLSQDLDSSKAEMYQAVSTLVESRMKADECGLAKSSTVMDEIYQELRRKTRRPQNWPGYVNLLAFVVSCFNYFASSESGKETSLVYTRYFSTVMIWFDRLAKFIGSGIGEANLAYEVFPRWWHEMSPTIQCAIVDYAMRHNSLNIRRLLFRTFQNQKLDVDGLRDRHDLIEWLKRDEQQDDVTLALMRELQNVCHEFSCDCSYDCHNHVLLLGKCNSRDLGLVYRNPGKNVYFQLYTHKPNRHEMIEWLRGHYVCIEHARIEYMSESNSNSGSGLVAKWWLDIGVHDVMDNLEFICQIAKSIFQTLENISFWQAEI